MAFTQMSGSGAPNVVPPEASTVTLALAEEGADIVAFDVVNLVKFVASDKARYAMESQFVIDAGLLSV